MPDLANDLVDAAARAVRERLFDLRDELVGDLARRGSLSSTDVARLRNRLSAINTSALAEDLSGTLSKYMAWSYQQGVEQVDRMLGGESLTEVFGLPPSSVEIAKKYRADAITTIPGALIDDVSRQISLAFIGTRTPAEVAGRIADRFDVSARRAETITRTEVKKLQNAGERARIDEAFAASERAGIPTGKAWIHSSGQRIGFRAGKARAAYQPRPHHKAMHDVVVRKGELFHLVNALTGEAWDVTGPHDEKLPVGEVANCYCGQRLVILREKATVKPQAPPAPPPRPTPTPGPATSPVPPATAKTPARKRSPKQPAEAKPSSTGYVPAGTPVSDGLIVAGGKTGKAAKAMLAAIEKVHGDGSLRRIPLKSTSSQQYDAAFAHTQSGTASELRLSRHARHPEISLVHEMGHHLDFGLGGTPGTFASESGHASFADLRKALHDSEAIKTIKGLTPADEIELELPGGKKVKYRPDRSTLDYLMRDREIFARAYAQFIAIESEDAVLLAQLRAQQADVGARMPFPMVWKDDDFEQIRNEFRTAFEAVGWMQKKHP